MQPTDRKFVDYLNHIFGPAQSGEDDIVNEIEGQMAQLKLNQRCTAIERLISSRLNQWSESKGFILDYLLLCYKRWEGIRGQMTYEADVSFASEVHYFLISYIGLILLFPTMFPQPEEAQTLSAALLVNYLKPGSSLSPKLIPDLVERFREEEEQQQLSELFLPPIGELAVLIQKGGILGSYSHYLDVLSLIVSQSAVLNILLDSQLWRRDEIDPHLIEEDCFLAGLLSLGVDGDNLAALDDLLPSRETLYSQQVESFNYTLRTARSLYINRMHQLLYQIIKSSPEGKEKVLSWFSWLASINSNRLKLQVDPATVSSDRIILNSLAVWLKFCEPFMLGTAPLQKLKSIDCFYYFKKKNIAEDVTKNNADSEVYSRYISQMQQASSSSSEIPYSANFITECFFLTVQYFRLGMVRVINEQMDLMRSLREAQQYIKRFEEQVQATSPPNPLHALALKNAKAKIQRIKDTKIALDVYLLDPELMDSCFSFISLIILWLSNILFKSSSDNTELFKMLPEFLVECIGEYSLFIGRFKPDFWLRNSTLLGPLFEFTVFLLDRSDLIKNPYIRSKFVEFLFGFTDPHLEHLLFDNQTMANLCQKLMKFYIEVEITGASSQFYDKFNIRYNISAILKCLWKNPFHRNKLIECSKDAGLFLRFVNLLVNDVTFLLDEAIGKLGEIHERQIEMERVDWRDGLNSQEIRDRESGIYNIERQCESYIQLATATLETLEYMSEGILEPFLRPEVIDRLAAMLCLNILQMVGPKCSNLKVRNPEKYHWQPRKVLGLLVGSVLNLGKETLFMEAMARDTRSFSIATFRQAAEILRKHGIRPPQDIQALIALSQKVGQIASNNALQEEAAGDIPEEFLDPLMFTLMKEPVLLETSGQVVDRSTIVAHLLNDPTDPFNRKPLSMEMIKLLPELASKIEEYKKSLQPNK